MSAKRSTKNLYSIKMQNANDILTKNEKKKNPKRKAKRTNIHVRRTNVLYAKRKKLETKERLNQRRKTITKCGDRNVSALIFDIRYVFYRHCVLQHWNCDRKMPRDSVIRFLQFSFQKNGFFQRWLCFFSYHLYGNSPSKPVNLWGLLGLVMDFFFWN